MVNLDKLNNIATPDPSWMLEAGDRIQNKEWLEKSGKNALKILKELKNTSMTQKELADKLSITPQQVNNIVKGREKLTLKTICKIEKELNIEMICIDLPKS
ncbi:MAG: helix-turn-helix transcriptional regulator [Bacteroidales bacterium]|jgi:ribosome-binding protein aMBF1 (putative translation factor)